MIYSDYVREIQSTKRSFVTALFTISLLSKEKVELTKAMRLPSFYVDEVGTLVKSMVFIVENGKVTKAFYPPEVSAQEVMDYLKEGK